MSRRGFIGPAIGGLALALALATTWSAGAELPMTPVLIPTFRIEGFDVQHTLRQSFIAPRNRLARVDLGVAPTLVAAELDVRIVRDDGSELLARQVAVPADGERQDLRIVFAPELDSRGRGYVLEIRRPPVAPPVALEGLDTDGLRDGQFLDPLRDVAATRALDMNVRLFQRVSLGAALTDLWVSERKLALVSAGMFLSAILGLGALLAWSGRLGLGWAVGVGTVTVSLVAVAVLRGLLGFA